MLICADTANHRDSNGTGSVYATMQSKNMHLKIPNIWNWKIYVQIMIMIFFSSIQILDSQVPKCFICIVKCFGQKAEHADMSTTHFISVHFM
jgi:hypothetical protein